MAVPDFQTMIKPLLEEVADGAEYHWKDVANKLAKDLNLTQEDLEEELKSGQSRFYNRVQWARSHMGKAGLLQQTGRGRFRITDRGVEFNRNHQNRITLKDLDQFPEHVAFRTKKTDDDSDPALTGVSDDEVASEKSPEEAIDDAYKTHRELVSQELLDLIMSKEPEFLEQVLSELLPKLGYGEAEAVGRTGDEGIDGIVRQDLLGFDHIYIQAKRWANTVGRPDIQQFLGSLVGKYAKRGLFVTTSRFSREAIEFVSRLEHKIILVDGKRLAELMYDYRLGVQEKESYQVMTIDHNYFEDE